MWSVLTNEIFVLVMFLNSCYYTVTLCHCDTVPGYTKFTAKSRGTRLQKETFSLSLPDGLRSQHSADRLVKHLRGMRWESDYDDLMRRVWSHLFKASLSESWTLEILDRSYFVCQLLSLLSLDRRVTVVRQGPQGLLVFPQIYFGSCKNKIFLVSGNIFRSSAFTYQ